MAPSPAWTRDRNRIKTKLQEGQRKNVISMVTVGRRGLRETSGLTSCNQPLFAGFTCKLKRPTTNVLPFSYVKAKLPSQIAAICTLSGLMNEKRFLPQA